MSDYNVDEVTDRTSASQSYLVGAVRNHLVSGGGHEYDVYADQRPFMNWGVSPSVPGWPGDQSRPIVGKASLFYRLPSQ